MPSQYFHGRHNGALPRAAVLRGVMLPTARGAVAITSAACAAALYLLSRRARKKAEVGNLDAFLKDEGDDELTKVAFTSRLLLSGQWRAHGRTPCSPTLMPLT